MSDNTLTFPENIEKRFQPPDGWQWHYFKSSAGHKLRYGCVMPEGSAPKAVIIGMQGLGDFCEKYFETARTLLQWDVGFFMIDLCGQGKSDRLLKDKHKRHSISFDQDVLDLHELIENHAIPALKSNYKTLPPLVLMGHSTGGNISMRYLANYPDTFLCAALTAPLTGIKLISKYPPLLINIASFVLSSLFSKQYLGFKQQSWTTSMRDMPDNDIHSYDKERKLIHNKWCVFDTDLQVGHVTNKWIHEALRSCAILKQKETIDKIKTPCLMVLADEDVLVDNDVSRHIAAQMHNIRLLELKNSKHEILMETDSVRDTVFKNLKQLMQDNGIAV